MEGQRNVSEFILLGLSHDQNMQIFCFVLFLFCYAALLVGNLLILVSIRGSPLFHQPMYYFLSHLSTLDICYTSSVTPKLIADLLVERKAISYGNCMLQVFAMHFFGMIEVLILTVMAFDRYAAICKPLHYLLIMNRTRCNLLVLAAWAGGAIHSFPQFCMVIRLPFCGPNEIDHYFCDIFARFKSSSFTPYLMFIFSKLLNLPFCSSAHIDHYIHDIKSLLKLVCKETCVVQS